MCRYLFLLLIGFGFLSQAAFAQTVIGDVNADVVNAATDNSAELKVFSSSNSKGVLIPTLTTVQMNGIVQPATGLMVYNTTEGDFRYYDGTAWVSFTKLGTVSTASKTSLYEGELKFYTTGNVLIFLNAAKSWRKLSLGAGILP